MEVRSSRSLTLVEPTDIPPPPESQTDRVGNNVPVKVVTAPVDTSSRFPVRIKRKPEGAAAPLKRLRRLGAAPSTPFGIPDDADAVEVTIVVPSKNAGVAAAETGGVPCGDPNVVVDDSVVIARSRNWEGPSPYSAEILSLLLPP